MGENVVWLDNRTRAGLAAMGQFEGKCFIKTVIITSQLGNYFTPNTD